MDRIDLHYFPGWTRKAITFTIDDGIVRMDRKLIDIVRPHGIKGTFNITSNFLLEHDSPETARALYQGYEIANHVKYHPFAFCDGAEPAAECIAAEPFPGEDKADTAKVYPAPQGVPGLYRRYSQAHGAWQGAATAQTYIELVDACKRELEKIFGQGSVQGFVWPYARQENSKIIAYLESQYYGMRTAGIRYGYGETTFDLPEDWTNWAINTRHNNLLQRAKLFEAYPDDGRLKWLVFGVHSHDFERDGTWDELAAFAEQYGNRPEDFWYASNIEVFQYADAVRAVTVHDGKITNPSDLTLYTKVNDRRVILPPNSTTRL